MTDRAPDRAAPPSDPPGGGVPVFGRAWPFTLLALALLGVGLSSWRPVPAGVWHDDGVYALVGKALAEGEGLTYAGVPGSPPAVKFAPGYGVLLAALWWVLPGLGSVTVAASMLNLLLLAAAGALFAWALHVHAGLPRRVALLAGGLAFIAAEMWAPAIVLFSEPLFFFLVAAAFALWPEAPEARPARAWGVGALLALAVLTRTAGIAVAAGMTLALLTRRRWRAAAGVGIPPAMVFLAWSRWSAARAPLVPEEVRDILGPYGAWLRAQLTGGEGGLLARIPDHAAALAIRGGTLVTPGASGYWVLLGLILLPVALFGFVELHRRFRPLPWVAAVYGAMMLLWPFADARLMLPLLPLVIAAVVVGGWTLLGRELPLSARRAVLVGAVAWMSAFVVVSASRVARGWAAAPYRVRAERLATAVEALSRAAPAEAVVGAPEFWAALHLHGGWRTTPSARFRPWGGEGGTPVWGTPEEQLRLWARMGVDHLLLEQRGVVHGAALDALDRACPGSVVLLAEMPGQMVVRLDWDEACRRRWWEG